MTIIKLEVVTPIRKGHNIEEKVTENIGGIYIFRKINYSINNFQGQNSQIQMLFWSKQRLLCWSFKYDSELASKYLLTVTEVVMVSRNKNFGTVV